MLVYSGTAYIYKTSTVNLLVYNHPCKGLHKILDATVTHAIISAARGLAHIKTITKML